MKKILLFLSFLLMSIGMFGETATFTPSNFTGQGTSGTGSAISATVDGVTFSCNKGYGTTQIRCYSGSKITISSTNTITAISFTFSGSYNGGMSTSYNNLNTTSWQQTLSSQARITQLVVTYSEGQTYTITAQSNNNSCGTVSKSGNIITASPNTCYTYASPAYTVSPANSATVSQNGNEFTVSATANTTVTINFEATPTYTVIYNANGGTVSPSSYTQQDCESSATLPTPTRDGYTFTGWYTASSGGSKIGNAGDNYTPTSDTTLYAQWEEIVVVEGETFELLTDISDLESGDEIIILNTDGTYALSTTQNNNNRGASNRNSFTLNNNVVTLTNDDVQIITVGGSVGTWTFDVGDGYLYAASSSSNHLKTQSTNNTNGKWAIALNGSYEASIVAQGLNSRNVMQFNPNNGTPIFSCYASASQTQLKIYKKQTCLPTISVAKIEQGGTFDLSSDSVCENGSVTLSNIIPSEGYKFDTIICVAQDGEDFVTHGTVNVSDSTISGITKDCYVVVIFSQLPPKPEIEIVEWNPDYIKVDIDNFDAVTAVIENKNTQEVHEDNVADSLFFSKYFEAKGNVKLLGLYNGTNHDIDLSGYKIKFGEKGSSVMSGQYDWGRFIADSLMDTILLSGNEIIFAAYQENGSDSSMVKCAKNNPKSGWNSYIFASNMNFNGNDAVALINPQGNLIDIIGAGNINKENLDSVVSGNLHDFMDDPGWYSPDGINVNTNDSNYALSTTRCLLIRKKNVKSGLNAVNKNSKTFVTLGGIYGEWRGLQIPKSDADEGVQATCDGFDDIGSFDYNQYYAQYTQVGDEILLGQTEPDGSYKINIQDLDTLSCTLLKVIVNDNSNNSEEREYKIPIFVTENTNSNSLLFSKEGDDCPECDVVIINGGKLTVNSELTNRDVTVYPGGVLVIPEGQTYNVNSLTLRRENNEVPYFSYKGNLVLTDKFYIDLRTDADDWRWMALPFSHKVSDIKLSNGKPINLNNDVWVSYYDGKYRSINERNAWKDVMRDTTFNAGEGFLFGVDLPGHSKKTYRFSFHKDTVENEKQNKTIKNLFAWGGENENLAPNHKGWNLIGNPFMDNDTTDIITPIRIGRLKKDSVNGQWTGGWVVDSVTKKLRYAVVPNKDEQFADAGYYESVVLDDYVLKPLTSFFVQLGGNEEDMQTLTFKPEKRINRIVARNYQMQGDDETFLRIKVDNWKTGCFISNKFTEDYEPGDDLESRYCIYQSIGGYKLLYSAINDSIIENGVKITAPSGNLHLDEKTNVDEFDYIYVLYGDNWYDLLHGETVNVGNGDFILQARRKRSGITTDINHTPSQGLYKYTDGTNIYINKNNCIFNIIGSKVK